MSLTLNDIINKDLYPAIKSCVIKTGRSKDGVEYQYLDLVFKNDWSKRVFLSSDGLFGLLNAAELLKSQALSGAEPANLDQKSNFPFQFMIVDKSPYTIELYDKTISLLKEIKLTQGATALNSTLRRHVALKKFLLTMQVEKLSLIEEAVNKNIDI